MWVQQTWTLSKKNLRITLQRHWLATIFRALVLPAAFMIFLSYAKNLLVPPVNFGIGAAYPIRSLQWGMDNASGGRANLVLVNSGFANGQIDRVLDAVAATVSGHSILRVSDPNSLTTTCRSTLRGVTPCYAAVVFNSSPTEGSGRKWNYTVRADGALGAANLDVAMSTNDAEIYLMPIQRAVDTAILGLNSTATALPEVREFVYTSLTNEQKNTQIRTSFQRLLINFMAAVLLIGMIGVVYHLCSFLSEERESGLSTLIEAMMPNSQRWVPQACRLISYWISFTALYLPGWLIGGIAFSIGIFPDTNKAIPILYHLLAGCALTSWAVLGGVFFRKAQLSGITVTLVSLILGVVVQVLHDRTKQVVIPYLLGLLFAPCNYVLFIITMSRFETQDRATNLIEYAPLSWRIYPIIFIVFLIIQCFAYIALAFYVERWLHGTQSKGRMLLKGSAAAGRDPIEISSFSKIYPPTLSQRIFKFWQKKQPVVAVNNISFRAHKGQILCLLGANGAGKSTTLDAVAGLGSVSSGTIAVNGNGGIGICPQRNVLWPELTVAEHVKIWNELKAPHHRDTLEERQALISSVDLDLKINAKTKTLSGGQKRKVQLAAMLTGGSEVCCVDEVSSGLDPLSRRKIWDILMAIRGQRTIIMTTHFLDESEVLADKICIMSKGTLRAEGTSAELKSRHGGAYRITVPQHGHAAPLPIIAGVPVNTTFGLTTYEASDATHVSEVVKTFERAGIDEYQLAEPTIDRVFLRLADEVENEQEREMASNPSSDNLPVDDKHASATSVVVGDARDLELYPGRRISFLGQTKVLFRKRFILFKGNWLPYTAAFLMPIFVAAIATNGLVKNQTPPGCDPGSQTTVRRLNTLANRGYYNLVQGPPSVFPNGNGTQVLTQLFLDGGYTVNISSILAFPNVTVVPNYDSFVQRISNYQNITTPGATWGGDSTGQGPTIAYMGDGNIYNSIFAQNVLNNRLTNTNVVTNYQSFNTAWTPDTGNSLQLVVYVCLVMSAYAAFFGLYICLERIRGVRLLEYGNGARSLSRWLAYLAFDAVIVIVSSAITTGLLSALSDVWYGLGYLFVCIMLFGICSVLFSYCVSLYTSSQLATFAVVAGYLAVTFLIYIICYLCMLTYAPVNRIDQALVIVNFTVSLITPMGSLVRALFLSVNLFSSACNGFQFNTWPGHILAYGGPIFYLCWQSLALFGYLLWYDSKFNFRDWMKRGKQEQHAEEIVAEKDDFGEELKKTRSSNDGLRVLNVTKTFGKLTAVENVTFGIERDEIFALLGPNGAGKSTVQSLIRGDIQPSRNGGDIFVNNVRLRTHRAQARESLGVCPQLDCMDEMTVLEHLRHYARMRGLSSSEIEHNVQAVLHAVGLQAFSQRMGAKLSGGNKRRLMLGISILGNPAVLLLDEPSSGMDIVGQRAMWKTLLAISKGRAILLTTHSMEESSALADRAGIMAKRMLALGTVEHLRRNFGDAHYVHLVCKTAPHSSDEEIEALRRWVLTQFPDADVEGKSYHGQMRFSVPNTRSAITSLDKKVIVSDEDEIEGGSLVSEVGGNVGPGGGIGRIITILEDNKERLGLEAFSVSPTTLDTVFLNIVQKHNVEEEGYRIHNVGKSSGSWWKFGRRG